MRQILDRAIPHRKKIYSINLATKKVESPRGSGTWYAKYNVRFDDGYEAEILQPESEAIPPSENGKTVCFKIDFRNDYGDQISLMSQEAYDNYFRSGNGSPAPAAGATGQKKPFLGSIAGTPRAVALSLAVQTHNSRGQVDGLEKHNDSADDVVATARIYENYLTENLQ